MTMPKPQIPQKQQTPQKQPTPQITFLDLAKAVVETWERSGYPWEDLVEGYGDGFGLGMPCLDLFSEVALDTVEAELDCQSEVQLRRLMRSRFYRRHQDFELHADFVYDNRDCITRTDLIQLAVWSYLWAQMQRQHRGLPSALDSEEEEDEPEQLVLPF